MRGRGAYSQVATGWNWGKRCCSGHENREGAGLESEGGGAKLEGAVLVHVDVGVVVVEKGRRGGGRCKEEKKGFGGN